jgi:hypothetical protein
MSSGDCFLPLFLAQNSAKSPAKQALSVASHWIRRDLQHNGDRSPRENLTAKTAIAARSFAAQTSSCIGEARWRWNRPWKKSLAQFVSDSMGHIFNQYRPYL